ncbi:uncharacterized protein LOC106423792 isoform X2 [Brassica napus]|uniref:uncharacterized protein LOC106423792 isoform X2 n=1 Tax=Brassica napus TaxID=3708 RepID=UPI00207A4725|nr:uncharacterized protein LOC106423792 isoform X2 [Brassica napus]
MGSGYSRGFKDSIGCLSERYDHRDMDSKRNLGKKVNWGFAKVYSGRDWQDSGFTKLFERDAESRGSCTIYSRMTQSQLLGNGGDMKNGEGNRKRLKISDNSDLIKSYSKTLIGRYMNPMEQDVKALLVTGVVLLEFCYHFRLYNGNIGVGVCSGTWLGIWIDWLGQCIMRLAPKLVPSNQLQEAELEMNRALGFGYLGKQVVERVWFKVAVERSVTKVLFMVCSTKEMAVGLGRSERLWYKFLASWSGLPIVGFTLVTGVLRFPDMGQMF